MQVEHVVASAACTTDQLADLQLAPPAAAAAVAVAPKASIRCFTEAAPDATLYFQIIDLGQQVYVWVSVGGSKFQNLYLAIQSRMVSSSTAADTPVRCLHALCRSLRADNAHHLQCMAA
jgi:hypothetical protein